MLMMHLFGFFSILVAVFAVFGMIQYLPQGSRFVVGFVLWLLYGGILSYSGFLQEMGRRPPGVLYLMIPIFVWVLVVIFSRVGLQLVTSLSLVILTAMQFFRVGVEFFLEQLWKIELVPEAMTYHGNNMDIFVGASAPFVAFLYFRNKISDRVLLVWNVVSLLVLANVMITGIRAVPGFLNTGYQGLFNTAVLIFPYTYIVILMVPLAVTLHLVSFRKICKK